MQRLSARAQDRQLYALIFCLIGIVFLSSAIGYARERRAALLVAWEPVGPGVVADQSLSLMGTLHLGDPFWFLR